MHLMTNNVSLATRSGGKDDELQSSPTPSHAISVRDFSSAIKILRFIQITVYY